VELVQVSSLDKDHYFFFFSVFLLVAVLPFLLFVIEELGNLPSFYVVSLFEDVVITPILSFP